LVVGFVVLLAFAVIARLIGGSGYSVAEEMPIFLLLFGLPAAVALYLRRKLSRQH
jgi:TRAP-type C4-dicarboxylate transport system permease small subunit